MKNFVQDGRMLTFAESVLTHPSHSDGLVDSGDPVVVGRIPGVSSLSAAATTDPISVAVRGVFNLSVTGSGNGVSVGETLFIDPSTAVLSPDLTDTPFGVALAAVAAGVTANIDVLLFGPTPGAAGFFS